LARAAPGRFLRIPFDVEKAFGSRARVSVKGMINGFAFRTSIFPGGDGTHHMMVNRAMQAGAKAGPRDTVRVTMEPETAPRAVQVPAALKKALAGDPAAGAAFAKLASSHQRAYAEWVAEAKQAETRARRIEKALAMLLAGKRLK
jgi:hypothetical protein